MARKSQPESLTVAVRFGVLALLGIATVGHAPGQAATGPIPANVRAVCLAQVGRIVELPTGRAYALTLDTLDGVDGAVTGVVSLYSADQRFDVQFPSAIAGSPRDYEKRAPIVIRFRSPVRIDSAVLTSIGGPEGGPCFPFVAHAVVAGRTGPPDERLIRRAATVPPIDAPVPVQLPHPSCPQPYRSARSRAPVQGPAVSSFEFQTGSTLVAVDVVIDDSGQALTASVERSSLNRAMDAGAVYAASHAAYDPEVFRCENVGGQYILNVDFER